MELNLEFTDIWGNRRSRKTDSDSVAKTFKDESYVRHTLEEDLTVYRVSSKDGNPLGDFLTRTLYKNREQAIRELALDPKWGNKIERTTVITIPRGTVVNEGLVAPAGNLKGGASQMFIKNVEVKSKAGSWNYHIKDFGT